MPSRSPVLFLLVLALVPAAVATAAARSPDPVVLSVLAPHPPGGRPGGEMFLRAIVRTRSSREPLPEVTFHLSLDALRDADDVEIATVDLPGGAESIVPTSRVLRLPRVTSGATVTVETEALLPAFVPPDYYFVLACIGDGDDCEASPGTIHVTGQAFGKVAEFSESDPQPDVCGPPTTTEYFPENPSDGMSVGTPFPCPLSAHGQWPGSCVYVQTKVFDPTHLDDVGGNQYCPTDHPYPYEVGIGFDPLWLDQSQGGTGTIEPVSFTKYNVDNEEECDSYGGLDPSDPAQRGYALLTFSGTNHGQAMFLCSDKQSHSALP